MKKKIKSVLYRYDLELHMVHERKSENGKVNIAVVGLLFKIGRPDPILTKVTFLCQHFLFQFLNY